MVIAIKIIIALFLICVALSLYGKYLWYKVAIVNVDALLTSYSYAKKLSPAQIERLFAHRSMAYALFYFWVLDYRAFITPEATAAIEDFQQNIDAINVEFNARFTNDLRAVFEDVLEKDEGVDKEKD